MRLLLAAHAFPPRSTAGVEVYTLRLARSLRALGHEVLVLAAVHDLTAQPNSVRRRTHEGVDVAEIVNVHQRGTLAGTYDDPEISAAASSLLQSFHPDCVHVQHLQNLSIGLLEEARYRGASSVFTLHDYWLSCPRDGLRMQEDLTISTAVDHESCARCLRQSPYLVPLVQRGLSRAARRAGLAGLLHRLHDVAPAASEAALRLLRRLSPARSRGLARELDRRAARLRQVVNAVDAVLAPTRFAFERALEFGIETGRLRLLRLGAVCDAPRPRPPGARRRLGFVGTLAPHKGVHVLVEAFRGVVSHEASLDLHGSVSVQPAYVERLRRAADGDPRIRFQGAFREGEQGRVLASLDALVMPSVWWENSPLVALEALAAGVPVVASGIGGVPELVEHGRSGLLVPPGDPRPLRAALSDVVNGRRLAEELPALEIKTVEEGARELAALYAALRPAAPRPRA